MQIIRISIIFYVLGECPKMVHSVCSTWNLYGFTGTPLILLYFHHIPSLRDHHIEPHHIGSGNTEGYTMPNLVPITTINAMRDLLYVALLTDPIRNRKADRQDSNGYVAQGAITRAYAVGGSIFGLPDRPDSPEPIEVDRKGSSLTSGKATDADVRLAQYARIAGSRGVAVLTRGEGREHGIRLTAKGIGTRNVPIDGAGLCPSERCNLIPPSEDDTLSNREYYFLRRYRDSKKGAAFAESMEAERRERDRAFWRAASPWWPLDKAGRFQSGKVRVNPNTGRGTLRFLDGSYLDDRIAAHKAAHADHYEAVESKRERLSRDAELALLVAEQAADRKAQRKGRLV